MAYKFKRAIVGGTFDRFHTGHQKLLTQALIDSEHVIIGVASNALFQHKVYADFIEDYGARKTTISQFLNHHQFSKRAEIVPINDFYGTSLTDKAIEAVFITESNKVNVEKINEERNKHGFSPLSIVTVDYVVGEDGEVITSQRIRSGQIDRDGNNYLKMFQRQQVYILPQDERESLRIPSGKVFAGIEDIITFSDKKTMIVAVGDVVAMSLALNNFQAAVSIIDGKTRRNEPVKEETLSQSAKRREASNKPGTITRDAVNSLYAAIEAFSKTNEKQLLVISGEEDLLAIPAILLSPLHSVVLYGLFGKGIVAVEVSEQKKHDIQDLFRKFQ
ncbi:MAG: pantetheine-phosphate adenylyltransferase [Candidatus Levyibacteriota bacterium]